MTTPANPRTGSEPQTDTPRKPAGETGNERPSDDPGRGQGDVFDDKLPPESGKQNPPSR